MCLQEFSNVPPVTLKFGIFIPRTVIQDNWENKSLFSDNEIGLEFTFQIKNLDNSKSNFIASLHSEKLSKQSGKNEIFNLKKRQFMVPQDNS